MNQYYTVSIIYKISDSVTINQILINSIHVRSARHFSVKTVFHICYRLFHIQTGTSETRRPPDTQAVISALKEKR